MLFDNGLREEQEEPLMQVHRQSLNLTAQAVLSFTSVELHPINLPDIWHEAAHCWQRCKMTGEGHEAPNGLSCQQLVSDHTTQICREESIVWVCVRRPSCFLSLCPLHPSLSSSIWHAGGVSTQGVEEKQLCSAVINPQDVIHELFTINSLSVYKCG